MNFDIDFLHRKFELICFYVYPVIVRWSDSRSHCLVREESPGSTETRCRVMPGGGDPRESAAENKPLF